MSEFLKGSGRDHQIILDALLRLRKRLVGELDQRDFVKRGFQVWRMEFVLQGLVRRVVEAADGARMGWNAGNILTCVTMSRSIMETAAVIRYLRDIVLEAKKQGDLKSFEEKLQDVVFGVRHDFFLKFEESREAKSILKYIDKMDSSGL